MRRIAALMAALVLMVAGCGGSGDSTSADSTEAASPVIATSQSANTTQPTPNTQPAVESATPTSAAPDMAGLDAKAIFDDNVCAYLGPAVVPLGAKATFEFDDGGHPVALIVGQVAAGTTLEEIVEYFEAHGGPDAPELVQPPYAVGDQFVQLESGVMDVEFRATGDYGVVCATAPEDSNRYFLGGLIQVIED